MTEVKLTFDENEYEEEDISPVAFLDLDSNIVLRQGCDEKKAVRVLNHEYLHVVIEKIENWDTSRKFDDLFGTDKDVAFAGYPYFSVNINRKLEEVSEKHE